MPDSAVMALGWEAKEASSAAASSKKASKKASSSDDSDDESEEKAGSLAKVAASKGGTSAAETARAKALATCGDIQGSAADSASSAIGAGIFVGGLPFSVGDDELRKHFESYGAVKEACVVMNTKTGKPKGFGFVEFEDSKVRDKVLATGAKQDIMGQTVEVKLRETRTAKGAGKDKGKDKGKSKEGKGGKDGKKGGKAGEKGSGKNTSKDGKGREKGKQQPQVKKLDAEDDDSDSSDEDEEDSEEVKPQAKAAAKAASKKPEPPLAEAEMTEEMKQMMALGLPVSFVGSELQGGSDSEDEEEDDDDGDDE